MDLDLRTRETVTNGQPMLTFTDGETKLSYDSVNQITGSSSYTFDADGNMTKWTAGGISYTATYDAENRLVSVSSASHSATFTYGYDGFLVKQVVDGVETRFVNAGGLCMQERNSSNTVTRVFVWDPSAPGGIGGLLEASLGGPLYYYLYDGKGNVNAVIDGNQNIAVLYGYDPFGGLMAQSGTLDQPYRFSTKYYYPEFGADNHGYRFYIAHLGRWLTRDPLGEGGGVNLYRAMKNNLLNYIDLFGLNPGDPFDSEDDAARDAGSYMYHISQGVNVELTTWIYTTDNGKFTYAMPDAGEPRPLEEVLTSQHQQERPAGWASDCHTHGLPYEGKNEPSIPDDINAAKSIHTPSWVATPDGGYWYIPLHPDTNEASEPVRVY
jgi:RHS repeat-associated protein